MEKSIDCSFCRGYMFVADSDRHIGIQVQEKGFIYKIPILFNGSPEPLYFCCEDCKKEYYKANVPPNPELSKSLEELREKIPQYAKECSEGLAKLIDGFTKIIKK